jgi:hypothetical protein
LLYPTIAAAVRAGKTRLTYRCPACDLIGDADASAFDRHPHASTDIEHHPRAVVSAVHAKRAVREVAALS